jgi:hypothetical protein
MRLVCARTKKLLRVIRDVAALLVVLILVGEQEIGHKTMRSASSGSK